MPLIRECVVTTLTADGRPHIAPLGLIEADGQWIVAPFRPSATLDNLSATPKATASFTDDALVFAKLVTGDRAFPLADIADWPAPRLAGALAHAELEVTRIEADDVRPRFFCVVKRTQTHLPFLGTNRARAAVLEAAILVSRLGRLPREKIESEIAYLKVAIDKTAGDAELEAWEIVMAKIGAHLSSTDNHAQNRSRS